MRKLLVGVALLCLLAPALADDESSTLSVVVTSVDLKAQKITFPVDVMGTKIERAAVWNERTKWVDRTAGEGKDKPATADLAKTLKKGSKIRATFLNGVFTEVVALAQDARL
jgi:hypothetical protein